MSKQYYKVVYVNKFNKTIYSALVNDFDFQVNYKIGEWTYPKITGTKLFVFDNKKEAIDFVRGMPWRATSGQRCIYRVEVKNPTPMIDEVTFRILENFLFKYEVLVRDQQDKHGMDTAYGDEASLF